MFLFGSDKISCGIEFHVKRAATKGIMYFADWTHGLDSRTGLEELNPSVASISAQGVYRLQYKRLCRETRTGIFHVIIVCVTCL